MWIHNLIWSFDKINILMAKKNHKISEIFILKIFRLQVYRHPLVKYCIRSYIEILEAENLRLYLFQGISFQVRSKIHD